MNKIKYKINKIYNLIFGEKFYKKLDFKWENLPKRYDLINLVIKKKNYKSYLEIGCDENQTFDQIIIENKQMRKYFLIHADLLLTYPSKI